MNEQEFRDAYAALQQRVTTTDKLKQRTIAASEQVTASKEQRRTRTEPHRRTHARGASPHALVKRWAIPAAACLVVAAVAAGGIPAFVASMSHEDTPGDAPISGVVLPYDFSIRAYAAGNDSILALGDDGTIMFDRSTKNGMPVGEQYKTEGYYTGCLFRVEGEGIARVQMNVTSGELYRVTAERFIRGEEPEKWAEALSWKSTKRGMGTYFSEYDSVVPISENDGLPKDSPDKRVGVDLSKRLGATIDVNAVDEPGITDGTTSFGLWTNDDYNEEASAFDAVIDLFDGKTLTVTVTFEDGHCATQVIALHAADIKVAMENGDTQLIPELVERSTLPQDGSTPYVHSLYGTVAEANNERFPLSLDEANEHEGNVDPASTLSRLPETYQAMRDDEGQSVAVTINKDALLGSDDTIAVAFKNEATDEAHLTFGYPTITRTTMPPNGKSFAEFGAVLNNFGGDAAYVNACSQQVFGYGFNDDGSLTSDEYSYLTAEFDITNATDQTSQFSANSLAEFGIIDNEEGAVSVAHTSYNLDDAISGDIQSATDNDFEYVLEPGQTAHVTMLRVLPNSLIDNESLLFLPGNAAEGFGIGSQV